jgi:peptidyl-prolyl cis-trans isomerase C
MKDKYQAILAIVCSALMFAASTCFASDTAKTQGENVLAQVDGYKLTLKNFNEQVASLPPQLRMAVERNPQLREQLLDRWVQLTLMALEARSQKMQDKPDVKKRIEDMTNALLAQEYMRKNIQGKAQVSDKEVKDYYEKHKAEFVEPEQVKARHILVKVPNNADEKAWTDARKKAEMIEGKLKKGGDFSVLAKEYSDDPGSKGRGGELGYFQKGRMVPEFEKAAFALKVGQISDPIKTTFGYHIIQVQDKKQAKKLSLDEVQQTIRQKLLREKQIEIKDKIIARLEKKYPVKLNKELLKSSKPETANK